MLVGHITTFSSVSFYFMLPDKDYTVWLFVIVRLVCENILLVLLNNQSILTLLLYYISQKCIFWNVFFNCNISKCGVFFGDSFLFWRCCSNNLWQRNIKITTPNGAISIDLCSLGHVTPMAIYTKSADEIASEN